MDGNEHEWTLKIEKTANAGVKVWPSWTPSLDGESLKYLVLLISAIKAEQDKDRVN
jgi:hypothetical protein